MTNESSATILVNEWSCHWDEDHRSNVFSSAHCLCFSELYQLDMCWGMLCVWRAAEEFFIYDLHTIYQIKEHNNLLQLENTSFFLMGDYFSISDHCQTTYSFDICLSCCFSKFSQYSQTQDPFSIWTIFSFNVVVLLLQKHLPLCWVTWG